MRIKSPRTVQQMQPLFISTICSCVGQIFVVDAASPNSFSITAIFSPWFSRRMRLSSVVLPAPKAGEDGDQDPVPRHQRRPRIELLFPPLFWRHRLLVDMLCILVPQSEEMNFVGAR